MFVRLVLLFVLSEIIPLIRPNQGYVTNNFYSSSLQFLGLILLRVTFLTSIAFPHILISFSYEFISYLLDLLDGSGEPFRSTSSGTYATFMIETMGWGLVDRAHLLVPFWLCECVLFFIAVLPGVRRGLSV